jgi:hypothetical protein
MPIKTLHLTSIACILLLSGCSAALPLLTEPARQTLTEKGLEEVNYYVASAISFRSIRALDSTSEEGPFKPSPYRMLQVSEESPGKFVSAGEGWITVDFGNEIVLTFTRSAADGRYTMRGWGTITIQGQRYDILVGVLSGAEVPLRYDSGGRR